MKQTVYLLTGLSLLIAGIYGIISYGFSQKGLSSIQSNLDQTLSYDELTSQNDMQNSERPIIEFNTSLGVITIQLYSDLSPKTVEQIITFVEQGYYDGVQFHRVIENFMIQGGDPLTKDPSKKALYGTGGPGFSFADEFNDQPIVRGSFAMANSGPNTNGSQFFIVTAQATPWLDGVHTNVGEVIGGMEVVDEISSTATDSNDLPLTPVTINSANIVKQ